MFTENIRSLITEHMIKFPLKMILLVKFYEIEIHKIGENEHKC